jgi:hypothetical protein
MDEGTSASETNDQPAGPLSQRRGGPASPRTTVWMVSIRTGLNGRKGQIWLEPGALVFSPSSDRFGQTAIKLADIRRVKQSRFVPVLDLRLRSPDLPDRIGLYFVEPPSLDTTRDEADDTTVNRISVLVPITAPRRRARKDAATSLREANPAVRDEVSAWLKRLKRAMEGARA